MDTLMCKEMYIVYLAYVSECVLVTTKVLIKGNIFYSAFED